MGFELSRVLRLGNKVLPKEVRQFLVHKELITEMDNVRDLMWSDNTIVEFWMDGFNDDGLDKAFEHIVKIYDRILCEDEQWHYFYEDHYSLIRCSYKFSSRVKKYLEENYICYRPITNWNEQTYMTSEYKSIYTTLFHNFSVLIIEMYKKGDGNQLYFAADRIIHPFFNHAIYLAEVDGQLDPYREAGFDIGEW